MLTCYIKIESMHIESEFCMAATLYGFPHDISAQSTFGYKILCSSLPIARFSQEFEVLTYNADLNVECFSLLIAGSRH